MCSPLLNLCPISHQKGKLVQFTKKERKTNRPDPPMRLITDGIFKIQLPDQSSCLCPINASRFISKEIKI